MTTVAIARPLVIGVGNAWRGDDGVGAAVVAALVEVPGLDTAVCGGEPAELMAQWAGRATVFVVDALVTGEQAGTIHRLTADAPLPHRAGPSSHGMGLAEAVELARVLDELPPELIIYGVEPAQCHDGAGLSPAVAPQVETVAAQIRQEAIAATSADTGDSRR
jgi:hydrogenase maturation protease